MATHSTSNKFFLFSDYVEGLLKGRKSIDIFARIIDIENYNFPMV